MTTEKTFSTQDLLLAAEVRKLAVNMRMQSIPEGLTQEQESAWRQENDIGKWVMPALKDLVTVAEMITGHP